VKPPVVGRELGKMESKHAAAKAAFQNVLIKQKAESRDALVASHARLSIVKTLVADAATVF
jgi:hypothetical protein